VDSTVATAVATDPAAVAAYGQALAALQGGDEVGAETKFQALTTAYPDYAGPLVNLAVIRVLHDDLEPATALLQRAVAVCTHCAAPWNELGLVQRRQGRFAEAEQSYLKAIAADPGYANAPFNLAVLYELYLQRPELALEQYGRFRELAASDPAAVEVDKWIADLARRTKTIERSAKVEDVQ
jgi:Flp pilus assembly protein TadD